MYTELKAFRTSEMTNEMFQEFRNAGIFVEDGFGQYEVGSMVREMSLEPESEYVKREIEKWKKIDEYFIKDGAENREDILIEHR